MPAVSAEQLLARLAKGQPIPGILLLGTDTYLRDLCRRKIVEQYVPPQAREWGVIRLSARMDSLSAILGQAQTLPMLARQQVIFVTDVEVWENLEDQARDSLLKELSAYIDDPAPFSVLVFEAAALDKRRRLGKVLADMIMTVEVELSEDLTARASMAKPLALDMARKLGVEMDDEAVDDLLDMLDCNLASVHTEIDKLAAYVGERRRITGADVALLVMSTRKYEVWDLTEMLVARQVRPALEFLDKLLREGQQPVAVVGALAWMYRKLLEAQEMPAGANGWQAASRLGMRPKMAEMALAQSRKFPRIQLTKGLAALYEADSRLKSGSPNPQAVMEFLVNQLASATAVAIRT